MFDLQKKKQGNNNLWDTYTRSIFFLDLLILFHSVASLSPQEAKYSSKLSLQTSQMNAWLAPHVYSGSVGVKWVHGGSYSRHWVTNIHVGCNSCGCVLSPNEAWVGCHLLKPNRVSPPWMVPGTHRGEHVWAKFQPHPAPDINSSGVWFGICSRTAADLHRSYR